MTKKRLIGVDTVTTKNKMLSYRRETALQGALVLAKSLYGHYRSIFNHRDIISLQSYRIRWKKCKIMAITPFKVIEVGTIWQPVCDFPLVINSNWHPILYHFGVIAAYCLNFGDFAFLSPLWGGLMTTYNIHLGLTGKHILHFLLVLTEGVTADMLRANIGSKLAISLQRGRLTQNFR